MITKATLFTYLSHFFCRVWLIYWLNAASIDMMMNNFIFWHHCSRNELSTSHQDLSTSTSSIKIQIVCILCWVNNILFWVNNILFTSLFTSITFLINEKKRKKNIILIWNVIKNLENLKIYMNMRWKRIWDINRVLIFKVGS